MSNQVFEIVFSVLMAIARAASPEILNAMEDAAKKTKNPWDDVLVSIMKGLINAER